MENGRENAIGHWTTSHGSGARARSENGDNGARDRSHRNGNSRSASGEDVGHHRGERGHANGDAATAAPASGQNGRRSARD